jgi:hypothetical protein
VGKTIQVTSAQVNAARLWIERADRDGTEVPDAIRKLAQAKPRPIISDSPITEGPRDPAGPPGNRSPPTSTPAHAHALPR